jgi:PIN domain nuclease of toxin-antitoxin system
MAYLLDTHAFLWALSKPDKLPERVTEIIQDPASDVSLSAVSIWEMAIKLRSGRLDLEGRSATDLSDEASDMNVQLIGLEPYEAATSVTLAEDTHFDPFDRMLIWQAIQRDLVLVSSDKTFERFRSDGLRLFWN